MLKFFASQRIVEFAGTSPASAPIKVEFDLQDKAYLSGEKPLLFERHGLGAPWMLIDVDTEKKPGGRLSFIKEHYKGSLDVTIFRGDIYECVLVELTEELKGQTEVPPSFEFEVVAGVEVTTIDKFERLPEPPSDIFDARGGATFSVFSTGFNQFPLVDFWLTETEVQLDSTGYISPDKIPVAKGIDGVVLWTNKPDALGDYIIRGRYPGKSYHSLVLIRDTNGAYLYKVNFEGWRGQGKFPAFERRLECAVKELLTVNSGDPSGVGELIGDIVVEEGEASTSNLMTWKTSLTDDEIKTYDGKPISLTNGNLSAIKVFERAVDSDDEWRLIVQGTLTDIDGPTERNEPAILIKDSMEGKIGPDEQDLVAKTFAFKPKVEGDKAEFAVTLAMAPKYREL